MTDQCTKCGHWDWWHGLSAWEYDAAGNKLGFGAGKMTHKLKSEAHEWDQSGV